MAKDVRKLDAERLVEEIVSGRHSISEIGIETKNQREAVLAAVAKRNALVKYVDGEDAERILKFILSHGQNYKLFVQLKPSQYTPALAQIYLYGRLSEVAYAVKGDNYQMSAGRSLDGKTTLAYTYISSNDDALHYMDTELGLPLSVKSSIKLTFKIENAVQLIEALDTNIQELGPKKINAVLFDILASRYRAGLADYITEHKVGYYTLCTTLCDVQAEIKAKLNAVYAAYGITVSDLVIRKIAIPDDIKNKVEDLQFRIRQRHAETEASAELASISLRSYEEKLAIQAKYPDVEPTLTEYEKDLALQRYLAKVGRAEEEEVDHAIAITGKVDAPDTTIAAQADVVPEADVTVNNFKIGFIVAAVVAALISLITMASSVPAGFIMLLVSAVVLTLIGRKNADKLTGKASKPDRDNDSEVKTEE